MENTPVEGKYDELLAKYEEENGILSAEQKERLIKTWTDAEKDKLADQEMAQIVKEDVGNS